MGRKQVMAENGEWHEADKVGRGVFREVAVCCDCGLAHLFLYKVVRGKLHVAAWRDNRTTAALRRHRKYPRP